MSGCWDAIKQDLEAALPHLASAVATMDASIPALDGEELEHAERTRDSLLGLEHLANLALGYGALVEGVIAGG